MPNHQAAKRMHTNSETTRTQTTEENTSIPIPTLVNGHLQAAIRIERNLVKAINSKNHIDVEDYLK